MSQQATQPVTTELDANIDALFNQLEPGAAAPAQPPAPPARAAAETPAAIANEFATDATLPNEPAGHVAVSASTAATESDPLLAEVAGEIERASPSVATPIDDAFQAPSEEELRQEAAPAPAATRVSNDVNVERLDAALAANADKALAAAQDDLEIEHMPAPPPKATAAPKPAPAPAPAPKVVHREPEPEVVPELHDPAVIHAQPEPVAPVAVRTRGEMLAAMLAPLRPLAAIHERLGESTRQTVAYCAVLTVFAASCAWALPVFMKPKALEPATGEQPFVYSDTIPAHGVTAPHKAAPAGEKAAENGGEGGGHGEAKKDAHAKPAKKSAGHGESAPAEKKTSTRTKKPAKGAGEASGGH